jgi:hypothetical protein
MGKILRSGMRVRIVRNIHAICAACGVCYCFLERQRTFVRKRPHGGLAARGGIP